MAFAQEVLLNLPSPLPPSKQRQLVEQLATKCFLPHSLVADISFHPPHDLLKTQSPHAHILLTMNEIAEAGWGKKLAFWSMFENLEYGLKILWQELTQRAIFPFSSKEPLSVNKELSEDLWEETLAYLHQKEPYWWNSFAQKLFDAPQPKKVLSSSKQLPTVSPQKKSPLSTKEAKKPDSPPQKSLIEKDSRKKVKERSPSSPSETSQSKTFIPQWQRLAQLNLLAAVKTIKTVIYYISKEQEDKWLELDSSKYIFRGHRDLQTGELEAKDGRGIILRFQEGIIKGNLSSEDLEILERIDKIIKENFSLETEEYWERQPPPELELEL